MNAPRTIPLTAGIDEVLKRTAPTARFVQEINVGVTEWATKIQPAVQAALQANPDINVVIPIYDSMSQFVVPAMRTDGFDGQREGRDLQRTPFVLDFIAQGAVDMNIGESLDWIAYATVDGHLRDACGMESPKALITCPSTSSTRTNIADAGTPAQFDTGYGDAYVRASASSGVSTSK